MNCASAILILFLMDIFGQIAGFSATNPKVLDIDEQPLSSEASENRRMQRQQPSGYGGQSSGSGHSSVSGQASGQGQFSGYGRASGYGPRPPSSGYGYAAPPPQRPPSVYAPRQEYAPSPRLVAYTPSYAPRQPPPNPPVYAQPPAPSPAVHFSQSFGMYGKQNFGERRR